MYNILAVDDDKEIVKAIEIYLGKENYKIYVRECKMDDIVEIDTFNELKKIDKTYDV